jgi:transcriptional regulator with XRE-family HTH domain
MERKPNRLDVVEIDGREVQRLRRGSKLTQDELSARLPVTRGYISRIERSPRFRVGRPTAEALASALGVSPSTLEPSAHSLILPGQPLSSGVTSPNGMTQDEATQVWQETLIRAIRPAVESLRELRAEIADLQRVQSELLTEIRRINDRLGESGKANLFPLPWLDIRSKNAINSELDQLQEQPELELDVYSIIGRAILGKMPAILNRRILPTAPPENSNVPEGARKN